VVREFVPAAVLRSRIVTYALKHKLEANATPSAELVLDSARREMKLAGIHGVVTARTIPEGTRKGEPIRRVVRICNRSIVGFALQVADLDPASSILLQSIGPGGKRHHGCGISKFAVKPPASAVGI